jgi:hypothetical protein
MYPGEKTTARSMKFWSSRIIAGPVVRFEHFHHFIRNLVNGLVQPGGQQPDEVMHQPKLL